MYNDELMHYGVKGMKWGVRRARSSNLSERKKRRLNAKYKKYGDEATNEVNSKYQSIYVKSWNSTADKMNNGILDKFNSKQEKKYGKNYADRDEYMQDYDKLVDKMLTKELNTNLYTAMKNTKGNQKAEALVQKYDMTSWSDVVKENMASKSKLERELFG